MKKIIYYLVSIVFANLLATKLGPTYTPYIAFMFIGFDLTLRDTLHEQWKQRKLKTKMGVLILAGSLISYLINRNSQQVALASFIAFSCAAVSDTIMYSILDRYGKGIKINGSNIVSAGVDSFLFLGIAFGFPVPTIIVLKQYVAKVGGGYVWYRLLKK